MRHSRIADYGNGIARFGTWLHEVDDGGGSVGGGFFRCSIYCVFRDMSGRTSYCSTPHPSPSSDRHVLTAANRIITGYGHPKVLLDLICWVCSVLRCCYRYRSVGYGVFGHISRQWCFHILPTDRNWKRKQLLSNILQILLMPSQHRTAKWVTIFRVFTNVWRYTWVR